MVSLVLDEVDKAIISYAREHPGCTITELSNHTKRHPAMLRYRILVMEAAHLLRYQRWHTRPNIAGRTAHGLSAVYVTGDQ